MMMCHACNDGFVASGHFDCTNLSMVGRTSSDTFGPVRVVGSKTARYATAQPLLAGTCSSSIRRHSSDHMTFGKLMLARQGP